MTEQIDYRVALILPSTLQLLANGVNGVATLPQLRLSTRERQVEQLTFQIREKWQVEAVVLDILTDDVPTAPCAILEVINIGSGFEERPLTPVPISSIGSASINEGELQYLNSICRDENPGHNLFAGLGWVNTVQRWITANVHDQSCTFHSDITQLNAGGGFALARLHTCEGQAYWVKAVGEPNVHEFAITKAISEHLPIYLPPVVAVCEEWNAWVTEETGHPLSESFVLSSVERVINTLAQLQIDSINSRDALKAAGCVDCGTVVLEAHLPAIFDYLDDAMACQTSTKVTPLGTDRLRDLKRILREACLRMQDLGIPDTLVHNDINPGNILLSESRCVFIDWAEGGIGNPFLTFQQLCDQISRNTSDASAWLSTARRCYRALWLDLLNDRQIDHAYALMPILAMTSYLFGRGTWLDSPHRLSSDFQAHARSLARCIDRAARAPALEELLCQ